jgi:Paraquat-inducible protein A
VKVPDHVGVCVVGIAHSFKTNGAYLVMLVAFRYHLQLLDETALDVYVTPKFGFYGFLFATTASLVIGHVMVFHHRHSTTHELVPSMEADSMFNHMFRFPDGSTGRLSVTARIVIVLAWVTTFILLCVGMVQDSFIFEFGGLAGFFLQDRTRLSYSLVSFGTSLPASVENAADIGIQVLRLVYLFYAAVTPLISLLLVLAILVVPLPAQRQWLLLTVAEIASAWSAIEVFGLSIIAAMFEISTFAKFIIGNRCDLIDSILSDCGDDCPNTCYTVEASVTSSVVYLLLGSVLNACWVSLVLRWLQAYMNERFIDEGDDAQNERLMLTHILQTSRFKRWILCFEDDFVAPDSNAGEPGLPELLVSPWQEEDSFASEWNEAAERDPTWKEWKEATNVT